MNVALTFDHWQGRLARSSYFFAAVLIHLVLFMMFATFIVFQAPVQPSDNSHFLAVSIKPPPPPPTPPPPVGGEVANNLAPAVEMAPPPATPTVIASSAPSTFSLSAQNLAIPNLPASLAPASGAAMTGHTAPGDSLGAGSPFGRSDDNGVPLLQGYLFDLKQTRDHKPTNLDPGGYHQKIEQFIASNWDSNVLRPYYKSAKPLNTAAIFIPTIEASDGPKAFGVDQEVQPNMYAIWYKVSAAPRQAGTYHFVGIADDILAVRVNGRTVLDGSDFGLNTEVRKKQTKFQMTNFRPTCGPNGDFWIGPPIHLSAGEVVSIDILIGEEPGGKSNYFLFIKRDESTYEKQSNGEPLLPVFQVDDKVICPTGDPTSHPPFAATPEPWQAARQ